MRVPTILFASVLALALLGLPPVWPGAAPNRAQAPSAATQPSVDISADGASLALLDFGGRAVVDMKINGHGPYRFVLGTAATMSILDSALQNELSLPKAENARAATAGGQAAVLVRMEELRAGGATARNSIAAVLPLKNFQSGASMPRGIISAAAFPGCLLIFDYPSQRVSIEKGQLDSADARSTFQYTEARPTVPIRIAGLELRVRVDTGSSNGLTLPTHFLKELPLASKPKGAGKTRTVAGDFAVRRAQIGSPIELGQYKIDAGEVYFSDAGLGEPVATIGYEVLRNFAVTLDAHNRRIHFAQPSRGH